MLTNKFMKMVFEDIAKSGVLCMGEVDVLRDVLQEFDCYKIECDVVKDGVQHIEFGFSCAESFYYVYTEQGELVLEFDYNVDDISDVRYNLYPIVKDEHLFKLFKKWVIEKNLISFDVLALDNVKGKTLDLDYFFIEEGKFVRKCSFSMLRGKTPLQWWEDEVNRYLANLYVSMNYYNVSHAKLCSFEKLLVNRFVNPDIDLSKVDLTEANKPEPEVEW